MSPRNVRRAVIVVFVAGIAGMIAGSIADNNGTALTFGLVTAVAALGLILVTAVAPPPGTANSEAPVTDEAAAQALEARVRDLVEAGADESMVRDLVRAAVHLGRRAEHGAFRPRQPS